MLSIQDSIKLNIFNIRRFLNGSDHVNMKYSGESATLNYVYSAARLDDENYEWLYSQVIADVSEKIETESLYGLYFEFSNVSFLIYSPRKYREQIVSSEYNHSHDAGLFKEILAFGNSRSIARLSTMDFDSFLSLLVTYSFALAGIHKMEIEEVERIKTRNTVSLLSSNYRRINSGLSVDSTCHVGAFSWTYFIELALIQKYFKEKGIVRIHDVATNSAHLPLLMASLNLSESNSLKFDICCSDINIIPAQKSIQSMPNEVSQQITLSKLDLLSNIDRLKEFDVIIANDVLEHFNDDLSFKVLNKLWEVTSNLLIIHVPIEEVPETAYGHFTSFTQEKLKEWSTLLDSCEYLTESLYKLSPNITQYHVDGFLILKKQLN